MSDRSTVRHEITDLLGEMRGGDRSAMDRLMPLVYDELRRRAHFQLSRGARDAALSTTGVVHETYLKLVRSDATWADRHHFFGVAAKAMRSIVVDHARRSRARKRGGAAALVELDEAMVRIQHDASEVLAIHEALDRLADVDPALAALVELRFFGGLSTAEAADALGVSERTVKRNWSKARTLLYQLLSAPAAP